MQVVLVNQTEGIDELRSVWDSVYAADESAHIFVSWAWLRAWFQVTPFEWCVLAARPDEHASFVAFLPLAATTVKWAGATLRRELHLGGKPLADYTGLVCLPSYERAAVGAFARYIKEELQWDRFHLTDALDVRINTLLKQLSGVNVEVLTGESLACPYMQLADTWDAHVKQSMSAKSRYDVRRAFRNVEAAPGFRLTDASRESLDNDLDTLLGVWDARWGKGRQRVLDIYRHTFRSAFDDGSLWLRIVWDGADPMAVLAAFVDPVRRTLYQHIMAFDHKFSRRSPGRALVGYTVRDAIERGVRTYDFLLGDEGYKYSFGARRRHANSAMVVRRSFRGQTGQVLIEARNMLMRYRKRVSRQLSSVGTRMTRRDRARSSPDDGLGR